MLPTSFGEFASLRQEYYSVVALKIGMIERLGGGCCVGAGADVCRRSMNRAVWVVSQAGVLDVSDVDRCMSRS